MTALAFAPAGELLTPTGVVLDHATANTPEWDEARRSGIGSSDLPQILGYSNFGTAADVWARKTGRIGSDPAGEAAYWGHLLEPVVAGEFAKRNSLEVHPVPVLYQQGHPHRRASLDRRVEGCTTLNGGCLLEVKTRSAFKAASFRDDIPDDILAQVQWQLLVTGLDHAHVAVLVDNSRYSEHFVEPEPEVQTYVATEADLIWEHVLIDVMPQVDNARLLLDLLDRLNPERVGQVELAGDVVADIRSRYELAKAAAKAADEAADQAKAELITLLGAADTACVDGIPVATYTPTLRATADMKRLAVEFPDAYAACVERKPTRPVLRWKRAS